MMPSRGECGCAAASPHEVPMPFAIAVQPDLIRVTLSGAFTGEDLRSMGDAAIEIEGASATVAPRITDMTGVTKLEIAYPDVQALAWIRS